MRLRTHDWAARAAGRSLAFALLAALLWLSQSRALALTVDGPVSPELSALAPSAQTLDPHLGSLAPITVVDERPDPLAATAPGASRALGNQLSLSLNSRSSFASSVYFTRTLPFFEALRSGARLESADTEAGLLALRGPGAEHVLDRSRALQQKLDYSSGGLGLRGSYTNVDQDFRAPGGGVNVIGDRSPMDALAAMRGMTDLQFQAQYHPSGAFMLDTSRQRLVNEQPGHSQVGMTVSEIAHALALQLGGGRQLKANFSSRDEEWRGHGAINTEKIAAQLNPSSRLALNYSYDWSDIQREGNQYKGRDLTDVKQGLAYQLTGRTRLDVNLNQVREAWDRGGTTSVTEKNIRDYALHHAFGAATKADLVRNFASVTTNGATVDTDTTQLHLEHGRGQRLNLIGDWMNRSLSDGATEGLAQLALDTVIGAGRSQTSLKGLYKQHSQGQGDKQVDTLYQLGLSAAPSPLAQFSASYESLDQQGPQADHAFVRTQLSFGSQLSRDMKLTADYAHETDKQVETKSDRGVKLEVNRGALTLTGGIGLQQLQDAPDLSTSFGNLQIKLGRGLAEWARTTSGAEPLPGAGSHGYRGTPAWAALGDGALSLNCIDRSTERAEHVLTRSLAYQTMLGRRIFLKLAQHYNPMVKKDNKDVMEQARQDLYEAGLDLGHGFVALGRSIREEDLKSGSAQQGAVYALQGAIGGRFKFTSGLQALQPVGGAATRWQFANLNLKLGRALADWAKAAGDGGLFDDNTKYGYRKLPAWAAFADGGLSLQYLERRPDNAQALIASGVGYQAMLGKLTYARLSFQQNPLTDKGQVIPVDRKLYELGRRLGGKFLALARYATEDGLTEAKYLRSSMLAVRGALSARERFETVIAVDDVVSPGQHSCTTTYGLEYAREAGEGHYFILKGTLCGGDAPGGILNSPDTYQVDLAYKKTL